MGRRKIRLYIKKGASPLYKRPTVPMKIYVVPKNAKPHYRTYYVAKFGEKIFKYSGVYGAKTKVQGFSKYIPYSDEIKDLMKQKSMKNLYFKKIFGSKFTKYLGLFTGVASAFRDNMIKEIQGVPFKIGVHSYEDMIKTHKSKIKGKTWEEELELVNGIKVRTKLTITDPIKNTFKIESEIIDTDGNVSKRLLEGQIEFKQTHLGTSKALIIVVIKSN